MRLIDADALKKSWRMANDCNACERNPRICTYETVYMRDICDAIDEAPTVGEWISVEDRLPEADGYYLTYDAPACMTDMLYYSSKYKAFNAHYGPDTAISTITHWMPLPEPPEVSE